MRFCLCGSVFRLHSRMVTGSLSRRPLPELWRALFLTNWLWAPPGFHGPLPSSPRHPPCMATLKGTFWRSTSFRRAASVSVEITWISPPASTELCGPEPAPPESAELHWLSSSVDPTELYRRPLGSIGAPPSTRPSRRSTGLHRAHTVSTALHRLLPCSPGVRAPSAVAEICRPDRDPPTSLDFQRPLPISLGLRLDALDPPRSTWPPLNSSVSTERHRHWLSSTGLTELHGSIRRRRAEATQSFKKIQQNTLGKLCPNRIR